MEIERIPLSELLDNLAGNQAAHPEYDSAVIRSMARMPINQYLGDYDTFCDFQCITGVREDLTYQATAKVIAEQVWSPEDIAQIVSILAAPVARIDEAYHRKDSALLPRCEWERTTQAQESLTSRLERTCTLAGPPYNLHRMPIDRFFRGAAKLTRNRRFLTVYRNIISPHVYENRDLFRQTVYEITVLEAPERTDLLYKILVEPFAALPDNG